MESTVPNKLVQRFGRKVRHDLREVRRIEQAREGTSAIGTDRPGWGQGVGGAAAATALAFRHELAMIRISPLNKQS
jgi:hypothetical protein